MTSSPSGRKHFLVDTNLITPYQTRVFIGQLAERGRMALGATPDVINEIPNALRRIARFKRHLINDTEKKAWAARQSEDIKRWMSSYKAKGLWRDWSDNDYRTDKDAQEIQDILEKKWAELKTDPEDLHLVEAAVLCGLDGLCSANMNMIDYDEETGYEKDWHNLMSALDLENPPLLCRREAIVDALSGCPGMGQDPEAALRMILPAMLPSDNLREPLLDWTEDVKAAFPEMSEGLGKTLGGMNEASLQRLRQDSISDARRPDAPVTRDYLAQRFRP